MKNSEIAAARARVALMRDGQEDPPAWLVEIAAREFNEEREPVTHGEGTPDSAEDLGGVLQNALEVASQALSVSARVSSRGLGQIGRQIASGSLPQSLRTAGTRAYGSRSATQGRFVTEARATRQPRSTTTEKVGQEAVRLFVDGNSIIVPVRIDEEHGSLAGLSEFDHALLFTADEVDSDEVVADDVDERRSPDTD